jgi:hypothetical protein
MADNFAPRRSPTEGSGRGSCPHENGVSRRLDLVGPAFSFGVRRSTDLKKRGHPSTGDLGGFRRSS